MKFVINIVKAEYQKTRKSMGRVFIWGFPMVTFALAFVLTLGMTNAYAESVWNGGEKDYFCRTAHAKIPGVGILIVQHAPLFPGLPQSNPLLGLHIGRHGMMPV